VFETGQDEAGATLSLRLVIPDYGAIVQSDGSRIIDARSQYVQVYLDGQLYKELARSSGTTTPVEFGIEWSANIPVPVPLTGVYGSIRLVFADSQKNPLTYAEFSNQSVGYGQTISLAKGCLPVNYLDVLFDGAGVYESPPTLLDSGKSVYYFLDAQGGYTYDITASGNTGSDVDLFIFGIDGALIAGSAGAGANTETYRLVQTSSGYFYVAGYAASTALQYSLTVERINQPPVADAGNDKTTTEGVSVTFSGAGSTDPEGLPIAAYAWDFDDSDGIQVDATGLTATTTYGAEGTYTVTLTVTDARGETATDTATVHVGSDNVAPVADAGTDQTAVEQDVVQFDGTGSYDPNPDDTLTYSWDFDDSDGVAEDATGPSPTYTYAAPGTYTVTLTVGDDDLTTPLNSTDTMVVTVTANQPPVARGDITPDDTVQVGETVTIDPGTSTDPEGDTPLTYQVTWGDGDAGTPADISVPATHAYTEPGVYDVVLTVTDAKGASDTAQTTVIVEGGIQIELRLDGGIAGDVSADQPISLCLAETDTWTVVSEIEAAALGTYIFSSGDVASFDASKDYILVAIHDLNDSVHIEGLNAALGDAAEFSGVYDGAVADGLRYDGDVATGTVLTWDETYAITFEAISGNLIVPTE